MGVARCRVGSGGLEGAAACPGCAPTAFALGDGGIARPSLGVRAPPLPPPRAGRRKGAGDDIMGTEPGVERERGVEAEEEDVCCEASLPCGCVFESAMTGFLYS
jgi:hypothetical protein